MTKTAFYQDFHHFQRKIIGSSKQNYRFFFSLLSYCWRNFFFVRELPYKTRKNSRLNDHENRYKSCKSSYNIKHMLIQKYVNAFTFNFIRLLKCNMLRRIHFFLNLFCPYLYLIPEVARQSHWPNLGCGSKKG